MKGRNPVAYALALRGKGKAMKDRRAPRGKARNERRDVEAALQAEGVDREGYPEYIPELDDYDEWEWWED